MKKVAFGEQHDDKQKEMFEDDLKKQKHTLKNYKKQDETNIDYSSRSSLAVRVAKANNSSDSKQIWVVFMTIFGVLVVVHSIAFFITEFGITQRKNTYDEYSPSQKCMATLRDSKFDLLDTKNYELWMGEY